MQLAHLVPVSLFGVRTIPGYIDEVVFAAKPHIKDQKVQDKFCLRLVVLSIFAIIALLRLSALLRSIMVCCFGRLQNRCFSLLASVHHAGFYEQVIVKRHLNFYQSIDVRNCEIKYCAFPFFTFYP